MGFPTNSRGAEDTEGREGREESQRMKKNIIRVIRSFSC
jgi:hypothetical protein